MKLFLDMKAWQLFALLFGSHFLMAVGIFGGEPGTMFTLVPIAMLVLVAVFMAWFWSLGTNINRKVPDNIRPDPWFFRFGIVYSSVYMLFFLAFFVLTASGSGGLGIFALNEGFHFLEMVCSFYSFYFVAKNLVMVERKAKVGFVEFAGPFFLLLLVYPIGVWFIQPRVNRMFDEEGNTQPSSPPDSE